MTLVLREVRDEDLDALFAFQADPVACAMADFPSRERPEFDALWTRIRADVEASQRVIEVEGIVVGHVGTFPFEGHREIGYWIGQEFWGRGHASEAVRRMLEIDPVRPLHAGVALANAGSIRVLEKAGFRPTGETGDDGFVLYRLDA